MKINELKEKAKTILNKIKDFIVACTAVVLILAIFGAAGAVIENIYRFFVPEEEKIEKKEVSPEQKIETEDFFCIIKAGFGLLCLKNDEYDPFSSITAAMIFTNSFKERLKSGNNSEVIKMLEDIRTGKTLPNCNEDAFCIAARIPSCTLLGEVYSGKYGEAYKDAEKNDIVRKDAAKMKNAMVETAMSSSDGKTVCRIALMLVCTDILNESDVLLGLRLLQKASDLGEKNATFQLGNSFRAVKDMPRAIEYYRACGNDHKKAIEALNNYKIANAPKELNNVKFAYLRGDQATDGKGKMEFFKDGKLMLSIEAKGQNLCFVEEVWADKKNNKMRLSFTPFNFNGKDFEPLNSSIRQLP